MAFHFDITLSGQLLTLGDADLQFDQIQTRNHFCHRMFDLQARIHFHEPEAVFFQLPRPIHDKFHRPGPDIIHRLGGIDRRVRHGFAHLIGHAGRGGFFDDFLVAAL